MAFGLESEGFWGKKEISYQHVHMFWSFWVSYIIYLIFPFMWTPVVVGFFCGLAMEIYQHMSYIQDEELPKDWIDSIRDLCFWIIGGCLNYIVIW